MQDLSEKLRLDKETVTNKHKEELKSIEDEFNFELEKLKSQFEERKINDMEDIKLRLQQEKESVRIINLSL